MDEKFLINYLEKQQDTIQKLKKSMHKIKDILDVLNKAQKNNKKIYVMGNGGSASTSTHFVADLLKTSILKNQKRFNAYSLTDNIPVILAWANDSTYDNVFVGQLENLLDKGDVVIGISGSGNSNNVINAIKFAKKFGATTISLTGMNGGKLAKISQINLNVDDNDMLTIETIHLLICHLLISSIRSQGKPLFSY